MSKDNSNELEQLEEEYFDKTVELKKKGETRFTNAAELVRFAAMNFTKQYREHLIFWKAT